MKRLTVDNIKIGVPLKWDVKTSTGRMLFRQGFIFNTQESLLRLKSIELYYDDGGATDPTFENTRTHRSATYQFKSEQEAREHLVAGHIFTFLDYCIYQIRSINEKIISGQTDQQQEINRLLDNIELLYDEASEACIGAVHLEFEEHPYSCLHPIYATILALMMARALGYTKARCKSFLGAVLTANLGMYSYHDDLVNNETPLTDAEFIRLKQHPELSHRYLVANGIDDQLWLDTVIQSHEKLDGTGYPNGLEGKNICVEARIYHVIDAYLAMVMPRAYRAVKLPKLAMKVIYEEAISEQNAISIGLIKQLGIYPPGSCVLLNNNTAGIVVKRNALSSTEPSVAVVADHDGNQIRPIQVVATSADKFTIIEAIGWQYIRGVDPTTLWSDTELKTSRFTTDST